ncbi:MAG: Gfo/Idh/MocA family protein [Planctomycetota bacterium]|jgi:predicted dehydrogenase
MNECDRRSFVLQSGSALAALSLVPELLTAAPQPDGAPMPVAVIGIGRQGRSILGELQKIESVKVAAICDVDNRRLSAGGRRAPGAEAFADHRSLLEKRADVKAVFVATPTHAHRDVVVDVLAAGRHVYCEGPVASTIEDCTAIAEAGRNAGTVVQAGLQGRSNPIYKLAWTFFRSDSVRDLIAIRAQHHRKTSWRTPASDRARELALNWRLDPSRSLGLAGEIGTQQFDVVHWFLGRYPVSVQGSGSIRFHDDGREVADTVQCDLGFADGVHLQYRATLANSFEGVHEVFYGSNAAIKLAWTAGWMFKEADAPTQGWEVYANREQFHSDEGITLIAEATKLAAQGKLKEGVTLPNPPLYYAIADFLKSVMEGEPVACPIDEGVRATIVGIQANRAVVEGGTIPIELG